jgi:hypothetical protein
MQKLSILKRTLITSLICSLALASHGAITGYWTYESQDLFFSARIGQIMWELDSETANTEAFGRTGQAPFAAVPHINGQQATFLKFPKTSPTGGYNVPHSAAPNGGGAGINQYTIIMDVLFPAASSGKRRGLIQTDLTGNAEFFIDELNRIGADGSTFAGTLQPDTWYRLAIAVDLTVPSVA